MQKNSLPHPPERIIMSQTARPQFILASASPRRKSLLAGAAAVIGHNWRVFIRFRGGRGEATTIGVLLTTITQPMLILAAPTILTLVIWRNVTLASAVLFVPLPFVCWWLGVPGVLVAYGVALPCLVGFTHFLRTRQAVTHRV